MIPTIETIVEDLAAGTITKQQAIAWLHEHASVAVNELRDSFAMMVIQGLIAHHGDAGWNHEGAIQSMRGAADTAYEYADAMLAARKP